MKAGRFKFYLLAAFLLMLVSKPAMAVQKPVPQPGDPRLKYYVYRENEVYQYTGYAEVQSRIDLDPTETIITISMGNAAGLWDIITAGYRIFIKPKVLDAKTNMTIITSKRVYYFELYSEKVEDGMLDKKVNFAVKFYYGDEPYDPKKSSKDGSFFELQYPPDPVPEVPNPLLFANLLNFNYTIAGNKTISPLEIFDDGEFTYIKFKDINADLPAIFEVLPYSEDEKPKETLVNYRKKEGYIIIEKVTSVFTLRFGPQIACIFNETMPLEKITTKKKKDDDKKFLGIF